MFLPLNYDKIKIQQNTSGRTKLTKISTKITSEINSDNTFVLQSLHQSVRQTVHRRFVRSWNTSLISWNKRKDKTRWWSIFLSLPQVACPPSDRIIQRKRTCCFAYNRLYYRQWTLWFVDLLSPKLYLIMINHFCLLRKVFPMGKWYHAQAFLSHKRK